MGVPTVQEAWVLVRGDLGMADVDQPPDLFMAGWTAYTTLVAGPQAEALCNLLSRLLDD